MRKSKEQNILIESEGGNNYYFSRIIPQVIFIHPILNYLLQLNQKGVNLEQYINNLNHNQIPVKKGIKASKKEIEYYYKYFLFLKEKNYFKNVDKHEIGSNRYNSEIIKFYLANTQQIVFEVTDACNLKCKYCGYGELYCGYDKRKNKSMDVKIAKKTIDYIVKLKKSPLNLRLNKKIAISFYGGEPLLNITCIKEIVKYIKEKKLSHNKYFFTITTNGTLLNYHMEFLVKNNFLLLISLDGDEKSNQYRTFPNGKFSYKLIYNNVIKLRNKYPDFFEKFVNFNAVLHNKSSQKQLYKYFKENFNKKPMLSELNMTGINPARKEEFHKTYKKMYSDLNYKDIKEYQNDKKMILNTPLAKNLKHFIQTCSGNVFDKYEKLLSHQKNCIYVLTGTCRPFEKKIFISVNGKVLPCEKINQKFYLGEIDKNNIKIDFKKIADKYNNYYKKMSRLCNYCSNSNYCLQCIFQLNIKEEIPKCDEFMNISKYKNEVANLLSLVEKAPQYYPHIIKET